VSGFLKWTLIAELELVINTCFLKLSVCIFILRFINRTRKNLHYFIYILMAFLIVSTIALVITLLVQCVPLSALYRPGVKGRCFPKHVLYSVAYVQGGVLFPQSIYGFSDLFNSFQYIYRLCLCWPTYLYPAEPSDEQVAQDRTVSDHGARGFVR